MRAVPSRDDVGLADPQLYHRPCKSSGPRQRRGRGHNACARIGPQSWGGKFYRSWHGPVLGASPCPFGRLGAGARNGACTGARPKTDVRGRFALADRGLRGRARHGRDMAFKSPCATGQIGRSAGGFRKAPSSSNHRPRTLCERPAMECDMALGGSAS